MSRKRKSQDQLAKDIFSLVSKTVRWLKADFRVHMRPKAEHDVESESTSEIDSGDIQEDEEASDFALEQGF